MKEIDNEENDISISKELDATQDPSTNESSQAAEKEVFRNKPIEENPAELDHDPNVDTEDIQLAVTGSSETVDLGFGIRHIFTMPPRFVHYNKDYVTFMICTIIRVLEDWS